MTPAAKTFSTRLPSRGAIASTVASTPRYRRPRARDATRRAPKPQAQLLPVAAGARQSSVRATATRRVRNAWGRLRLTARTAIGRRRATGRPSRELPFPRSGRGGHVSPVGSVRELCPSWSSGMAAGATALEILVQCKAFLCADPQRGVGCPELSCRLTAQSDKYPRFRRVVRRLRRVSFYGWRGCLPTMRLPGTVFLPSLHAPDSTTRSGLSFPAALMRVATPRPRLGRGCIPNLGRGCRALFISRLNRATPVRREGRR
jgi:hypothetical protein